MIVFPLRDSDDLIWPMCLCQHESCYDGKHNFSEITILIAGVLFCWKHMRLLVLTSPLSTGSAAAF